jgi:hypothetical protein
MNDFFTNETNLNPEGTIPSAAEEQEIRDKIQAEVFEGTPAKFDDVVETTKKDKDSEDETSEDDIAAGLEDKASTDDSTEVDSDVKLSEPSELPPEMQAIVDSINNLTTSLSGMEDRIKQTERRVGGITNEFHAAKEAAANQAKAPTAEEMATAAKDSEAWEELKKDFPSWATAINSKIKTQTSNFVSVSDFEALRQSVSKTPSVDPNQLETRLVGLIHPDWKQITRDPKYASWLNAQPADVQHKAYKGTTAEEAIDVFNKFKAQKINSPSPAVSEVTKIKDQRAKRLAASTTTNNKHKTIKAKAEADMSESELREHIANKVFAK